MKKFSAFMAFLAAFLFAAMPLAEAQTYAFQNPTYIPTAILAPTTFSATGDYYFNANGVAGGSVRIAALSGTLVAAIQGSNDALSVANASASWTTVKFVPADTGVGATSITANGLYLFSTAGFTRFRVHITTLSGGSHVVTVTGAATVGGMGVYVMNQSSSANPGTTGIDQTTPGTTNGVYVNSIYPSGATPLTASATGTTAATTATLAGTTGKTTYICGFRILSNATAAVTGTATITGTITATMSFIQWTAPLASGIGSISQDFSRCIPASTTNTGIAVVSAAPGSGGMVSVDAWGFQL